MDWWRVCSVVVAVALGVAEEESDTVDWTGLGLKKEMIVGRTKSRHMARAPLTQEM